MVQTQVVREMNQRMKFTVDITQEITDTEFISWIQVPQQFSRT